MWTFRIARRCQGSHAAARPGPRIDIVAGWTRDGGLLDDAGVAEVGIATASCFLSITLEARLVPSFWTANGHWVAVRLGWLAGAGAS